MGEGAAHPAQAWGFPGCPHLMDRASWGFYNEVLQTRLIKASDTLSLTVWRPHVQNQGVSRAVLPLEAPGEDASCLFRQLLVAASQHPWLVAASTTPVSATVSSLCICVHISPFW